MGHSRRGANRVLARQTIDLQAEFVQIHSYILPTLANPHSILCKLEHHTLAGKDI